MVDIEKIYRAYSGDCYHFLLSLCKDENLAEDLTSETFLKLIGALSSIKKEEALKTYIFQIAKNTYFSYLKREGREVDLENFEPEVSSFEEEFLKDEEKTRLKREIEGLKSPYSDLVKLRVYGDLSFKEIGEIYGKSQNRACVSFYRAKEILKERMGRDE